MDWLLCEKRPFEILVLAFLAAFTRASLFLSFSVAKDVADRAWVGAEFFRLPEERQKVLLAAGNMLFCRTEPKDKQRLVKMLQDMGEVCKASTVTSTPAEGRVRWRGYCVFYGCPRWLVSWGLLVPGSMVSGVWLML